MAKSFVYNKAMTSLLDNKVINATITFFKKAFSSKWKWLLIGALSVIFLYATYFIFIYNPSPTYTNKDGYWKDYGILSFHILSGVLILFLLFLGFFLWGRRKLTVHKATTIIALIAALWVMVYGLSTPIYNYNGLWNQHDLYYGDTHSRYLMENGIYDGGGGHFGMIMSVYRYSIIPEIVFKDGAYDYSFSAVLERYQPKMFYLVSGFFMKFNSLFIHSNEMIVNINGSEAYGLTNREWALYESLRLLYTMMEWLQIYFIYKIFKRIHLEGKGLLIAFALAIFNPMWCFFANWTNNDGMSTFFSIVAIYYVLCYMQDRKTYQVLLIAMGIGFSMACKLGGALVAIVIAPMLLYVFVKSIKEKKQENRKLPPWALVLIQLAAFALVVFPLGLGWPLWSYIKFGQPIVFFSPVNNDALYIQNESFFERFILFPNSDTFRLIWVYHSNKDPNFIQDTSLLTALVKTSLYGEYGFGLSSVQCATLYGSSLALIFIMMLLLPYRFIRFIMNKEKKVDLQRIYLFASILIVFYGWAVYFVSSYPHTCNEDMRYIALIIIPLCGLVGSTFSSFEEENIAPMRIIGKGAITLSSIFFVSASIIAYLTMSPWYYR